MTPQFKIIAILVLVTALITGCLTYLETQKKKAYDSGYDTARLEMLEDFQKDLEASMKNKQELLDNAILESNKWKKKAIELQNRKPVTVTETEVVEIVKINNDCKRLRGVDKLFNRITEANFAD